MLTNKASYAKFSIYLMLSLLLTACSESQEVVNVNQVAREKASSNREGLNKDNRDSTPLKIESFDWQGQIPEGKLVIVDNQYGSIRSRNHSGRQVFLHATYQLIGEKALSPKFDIEETQDWVKIKVVYNQAILDKQGRLRGRTDISILFPDDVSLFAKTDKGLIKIDKSASHVQLVTNSGEIKLDTRGLFDIQTKSGLVDIKLRGQKEKGISRVNTQSGQIKAEIFKDMSLFLSAKSFGKVILNQQTKGKAYQLKQFDMLSNISLESQSGIINLTLVDPPALVQSIKPSNATSVDIDLTKVQKSKTWKPGDPIYDRQDKIQH